MVVLHARHITGRARHDVRMGNAEFTHPSRSHRLGIWNLVISMRLQDIGSSRAAPQLKGVRGTTRLSLQLPIWPSSSFVITMQDERVAHPLRRPAKS